MKLSKKLVEKLQEDLQITTSVNERYESLKNYETTATSKSWNEAIEGLIKFNEGRIDLLEELLSEEYNQGLPLTTKK